jgi:TolA-binding protein
LERLIRIEEQHRAAESASNSRLLRLENNVEMALSRTEKSSQQMKDLEQTVMQLNSKLSTLNGFMELLQGENESKRSAISKMDHWIRQV